jgi:hypothetical protein
MKTKPTHVERSLGGNLRLVWTFKTPLVMGGYDFCTAMLQELVAHLNLTLLPMLDEPAFTTPSRLLANGCNWKPTGFEPPDMQAFFVKAGAGYRFKGENLVTIEQFPSR